MKSSRFDYAYNENASYGHCHIGNLLRNSKYFKNYRIFQEYPVSRINPAIKNNKLKYDWVILDLKVVIEIMGVQHECPTRWSKQVTEQQMYENFYDLQRRDRIKKNAAIDAGYTYIAIQYKDIDSVDEEFILNKLNI
jgi:hypothetical protein